MISKDAKALASLNVLRHGDRELYEKIQKKMVEEVT